MEAEEAYKTTAVGEKEPHDLQMRFLTGKAHAILDNS
jgi:hypothetical protein